MSAKPYAEAARDLLRDTLLDALRGELGERDWSEVTMAAVARGAGVSRQTVYNEFGSRDELAQAFVLREGARFLDRVDAAIAAHASEPERALRAAFAVVLTGAASDPVVRAALRPPHEQAGLLPQVTTRGRPLLEFAADHLSATLQRTWPSCSEQDAALLSECLVRLAISYATLPNGPEEMAAASVTTLLAPFAARALSDA